MPACPFCARIAATAPAGEGACAFDDAFPSAPGHRLVVPVRHEADLFALSAQEQQAVWTLVAEEHARLREQPGLDGVTVGVNVGVAAGQTVAHAHVHLIPRRHGDVEDPRGGVRWVLPETAAYWER